MHLQRQIRGDVLAVGRVVGAEVRDAVDADRLELVVGVEGGLGDGDVVAPAVVGQHRLAAAADPVDRAAEGLRREGDEEILRVGEALDAEAAADVRGGDADGVAVEAELLDELVLQPPDPLTGEADVEAGAVPFGGRPALLHRHRHDPVVDELEPGGVGGLREDAADLGLVAEAPVVGEVVGSLGVDRRPSDGGLGMDGEVGGLEGDRLDRVEGGGAGLGDDHRDRLAGVADGVGRRASGGRAPPRGCRRGS